MLGIGDVIQGKYRLIRLLGEGGMGSVFEAQHEVLGTKVAIKVLHPELMRRTGLVERFLQEARVAAQIRSPHVVNVVDVDRTHDGHAYIVMELLEGEPLSSILDRQRRLTVPTSCEYTVQILEALEAAHALGVIHRDLKPENVFVTHVGGKPVLKLIDFGIAKAKRSDTQQKNLTVAGVLMGTAEYMAPEQARSADRVDARSDIYAVGVMLYEMIAGTRPVLGEDARVVALKVERGEVTPLVQAVPDAPREIAGLVHRAMAARPELRFSSAAEMRLALQEAMAGKRRPTGVQNVTGPMAAVPQPQAQDLGTGTLKNVPAAQVLAGASGTRMEPHGGVGAPPSNLNEEPKVNTVRTPPVGAVPPPMPMPMAPPPMPYPQQPARRKKSGGGMLALLIALPILLGAGVVAVLVITSQSGGAQPDPQPTSKPTVTTVSDAGASGPSTPGTSTGPDLPPLNPSGPTPPSTPGTGPRPPSVGDASIPPSTSDAAAPIPGAGDGGGSPIVIPSTIPSTIPPLPSIIPSTLPFPFPGAPQQPTSSLAPLPPPQE